MPESNFHNRLTDFIGASNAVRSSEKAAEGLVAGKTITGLKESNKRRDELVDGLLPWFELQARNELAAFHRKNNSVSPFSDRLPGHVDPVEHTDQSSTMLFWPDREQRRVDRPLQDNLPVHEKNRLVTYG